MSSPVDPILLPILEREAQLDAALRGLSYPPATENAPGWLLQRANNCTCEDHPRAPETAFAVFWVQLQALAAVEPPEGVRADSDRALASIALDLQLLGFPAVAQGENNQHGGFAAVLVSP